MPEWTRLVAERLAHIRLRPDVRREVVAEIAAHLEERHAELLRTCSLDPEGETLAQVSDWKALARRIRRAKEDRMGFARKVLMPGVAAVILAAALKLSIYLFITPEPCGPDLTCLNLRGSADGPGYLPWLATLPFAGALAAGLARHFGARPAERFVAALFPAVYLSLEFVLMGLVSGFFFWRIPIYWGLVPTLATLACAIGACPFLGDRRGSTETRPVSSARL